MIRSLVETPSVTSTVLSRILLTAIVITSYSIHYTKLYDFEALIRFKTIVAPYDGVVTVRNINAGDYVNKEGTISSSRNNFV